MQLNKIQRTNYVQGRLIDLQKPASINRPVLKSTTTKVRATSALKKAPLPSSEPNAPSHARNKSADIPKVAPQLFGRNSLAVRKITKPRPSLQIGDICQTSSAIPNSATSKKSLKTDFRPSLALLGHQNPTELA